MAQTEPQTETLSLRISESLRHRLKQIRDLVSRRKGESVSTSEIAKQLLESAREERLEAGWRRSFFSGLRLRGSTIHSIWSISSIARFPKK
jgi:hypothetical protein